jgi:ribosomal RNA-processing protein 36
MKRSGAVVHTSVATLPRGDSLRGGPGKDGSRRGSADAPKTRRSNKHRPLETTSKRPVPRYREVVQTAARRARDPRFDTMSGRYDAVGCARSYAFLDEYREVESAQLSKQMKMVKGAGKQQSLSAEVSRLANQTHGRQKQLQLAQRNSEIKKISRSLVQQGHKPFYLKKSELKKVGLAAKYMELRNQGGDSKVTRPWLWGGGWQRHHSASCHVGFLTRPPFCRWSG